MSDTSPPEPEQAERRPLVYCDDCGRAKGIGCACGLSFAEKIKGVAATLPDSFRAVPRSTR